MSKATAARGAPMLVRTVHQSFARTPCARAPPCVCADDSQGRHSNSCGSGHRRAEVPKGSARPRCRAAAAARKQSPHGSTARHSAGRGGRGHRGSAACRRPDRADRQRRSSHGPCGPQYGPTGINSTGFPRHSARSKSESPGPLPTASAETALATKLGAAMLVAPPPHGGSRQRRGDVRGSPSPTGIYLCRGLHEGWDRHHVPTTAGSFRCAPSRPLRTAACPQSRGRCFRFLEKLRPP